MPLSRIERERQVFGSCLELDQAQRSAYLARACDGDSALRERVERLLDIHDRASNTGGLMRPRQTDLPDVAGRYRIVGLIGEGGMGAVYEAEQQEPVRRMVALKVVKLVPGTEAGAGILARFASESQALAMMEHPNVAKVFDAGETLLGYPYFVMELVSGEALTTYCNRRALPQAARLRLFIQLCHAVQHAHQKGVIHRDLKPSNVLVTEDSGTAQVKVIDFGIAKAVGGAAFSTGAPQTNQPLGTPAYMSPEQASTRSGDVDTRSDIYSLAVILYELVTGTLPADPAQHGYSDFLVRLALGELPIPPPSTRVPAQRRLLQGDLDSIVLRGLASDRAARYSSAGAFAEDVERFLRHEPVLARPTTATYRLTRFIRRHRVQTAAAAIAAVALVLGSTASAIGYLRAARAEAAAREEAATAREVSTFLSDLFLLSDPNRAPNSPMTAQELLDRGASRVETELKGRPRVQADLLATLSHVREAAGNYSEARKLAEKSLQIAKAAGLPADLKTADALLTLGRVEQRTNRFTESQRALENALAIRTRLLGERSLPVAVILNHLGALHGQLEHFDLATAYHERALRVQRSAGGPDHISTYNSLRGLGMVHDRRENNEAALASFQAAQKVVEARYGAGHPAVTSGLADMGRVLLRLKRHHEARQAYERALQIQQSQLGPDAPELAFTYHGLGKVLVAQGDMPQALAMLREGLRIREAALGPDNTYTADILSTLGALRLRMGETGEGLKLLSRTFEIHHRRYGPEHSQTMASRRALALALVSAGRYDSALPHLRELARPETPPAARVDLRDAIFDPMRSRSGFRALEQESAAVRK